MLDNGWFMNFDSVFAIAPLISAFLGLEGCYDNIITTVGDRIFNAAAELANIISDMAFILFICRPSNRSVGIG